MPEEWPNGQKLQEGKAAQLGICYRFWKEEVPLVLGPVSSLGRKTSMVGLALSMQPKSRRVGREATELRLGFLLLICLFLLLLCGLWVTLFYHILVQTGKLMMATASLGSSSGSGLPPLHSLFSVTLYFYSLLDA